MQYEVRENIDKTPFMMEGRVEIPAWLIFKRDELTKGEWVAFSYGYSRDFCMRSIGWMTATFEEACVMVRSEQAE